MGMLKNQSLKKLQLRLEKGICFECFILIFQTVIVPNKEVRE